MNPVIQTTLAASGLFLLAGMAGGVLKYLFIMNNAQNKAPMYIDMLHRSAFLYSAGALVMAELLRYSPYSVRTQWIIAGVPLFFFTVTVFRYFMLGIRKRAQSQFSERTFATTWGMALLIIGEIGCVTALVWGFVKTQFLS